MFSSFAAFAALLYFVGVSVSLSMTLIHIVDTGTSLPLELRFKSEYLSAQELLLLMTAEMCSILEMAVWFLVVKVTTSTMANYTNIFLKFSNSARVSLILFSSTEFSCIKSVPHIISILGLFQ